MKIADMTMEELRSELRAEFDEIYVRQKDCSERHEQTNEKMNDISIHVATQGNDIVGIKKFQWLIESTIVAGFLGAIIAVITIAK